MDLLTVNDRAGEYPTSYYAANAAPLAKFPSAQGAISCDVCVVGAGFMGLSSALHLAKKGYDVVLLDAQRVGFGASGRNGGQVGQGQRVDQDDLEQMVGKDHARELWKIATQSVELVRSLSTSDHVRADFHEGVLHTDHRKRYVPHSREYARKLNEDYGYDKIRFVDEEECRHLVNSPAYHGGTLDLGAGHINRWSSPWAWPAWQQKLGCASLKKAGSPQLMRGIPPK